MAETETPQSLQEDLRTDWHRYVDALVPLRADLYGYCRGLTGTVWDAEDLAQDTLVRAFGRLGVSHPRIVNPRAYLLRTATNVWIDLQRRVETRRLAPDVDPESSASSGAGPSAAPAVRDAGARLLQRLSPQERAAVVLKEVFDMKLAEIAEIVGTTTGAVKAAIHRGRGRLREEEGGPASQRSCASPQLLDGFIERWKAGDLPGLIDLMLENGSFENVGNSFHFGLDPERGVPDPLRAVLHGHPAWPKEFLTTNPRRVERIEFDGERVLAWYVQREEGEALTNVMRIEESEGRIARIRSYGFCPDTILAIAKALGVRAWTGIYRAPTPAPGKSWPGESAPEE